MGAKFDYGLEKRNSFFFYPVVISTHPSSFLDLKPRAGTPLRKEKKRNTNSMEVFAAASLLSPVSLRKKGEKKGQLGNRNVGHFVFFSPSSLPSPTRRERERRGELSCLLLLFSPLPSEQVFCSRRRKVFREIREEERKGRTEGGKEKWEREIRENVQKCFGQKWTTLFGEGPVLKSSGPMVLHRSTITVNIFTDLIV